MDRERIQTYLDLDFHLLFTGSKFLGAPSFCGGLLCPQNSLEDIQMSLKILNDEGGFYFDQLSLGYGQYNWINHGLFLRWKMAIFAAKELNKIPQNHLKKIIQEWNRRAKFLLNQNGFETENCSQGCYQKSIINFFLNKKISQDLERVKQIRSELSPHEIGQPVKIGHQHALRIALSAPNIIEAYTGKVESTVEWLIIQDRQIIAELTQLISR